MSVYYRQPALSAAANMNRINRVAVSMRRATRAAIQQAAENAEVALRLERGEEEEPEG
jgi:hypothetical protein